MSDISKECLYVNLVKMINKKITDSLQSKKRVSFEKSYGKETLKSRDSVMIDPSPICMPQHNVLSRRSIADLFSEFNVSDPLLPSNSIDATTKVLRILVI